MPTPPLNPTEELEAFQDYLNGKDVEEWDAAFPKRGWYRLPCYHPWLSHEEGHRHRPLRKPEPQPWTQDDVPAICWIRRKECPTDWHHVIHINSQGVHVSGMCRSISWTDLASTFEYSTELITWKPCAKEAGSGH